MSKQSGRMRKHLNFQKLEEQYIDYVRKQNFVDKKLQVHFINLLTEQNLRKKQLLWEDITNRLPFSNDYFFFANPFYLGLGNPNADILFIGKEQGFGPINDPELYFYESICNLYLWKRQCSFDSWNFNDEDEYPYNPVFPLHYLREQTFKPGHTWRMYNKFLNYYTNQNPLDFHNRQEYLNSFFSRCFTTEISHLPAKSSPPNWLGLPDERKDFLSSDFFRSFPVVIVGARTYIGTTDFVQNVFRAEKQNAEHYLDEEKERLPVAVYKSSDQVIAVCNQLSGGACWSDAALKSLVEELKIHHPNMRIK